ncbi:helix-turn-helix domain-containing protein [Cellulosimicrobium funkei]|uniref:helix-turn-helix domain-containing protein n=1 Tax=Cellulosimicrobium funkei TaxID=264251 RepID=UPI0037DBF3B9
MLPTPPTTPCPQALVSELLEVLGELRDRLGLVPAAPDRTTPMLSIDDVAAKCGVSVETVRRWRSTGVGPQWKRLGKHLRCEPADFRAWLDSVPTSAGPTVGVDYDGGWG